MCTCLLYLQCNLFAIVETVNIRSNWVHNVDICFFSCMLILALQS